MSMMTELLSTGSKQLGHTASFGVRIKQCLPSNTLESDTGNIDMF